MSRHAASGGTGFISSKLQCNTVLGLVVQSMLYYANVGLIHVAYCLSHNIVTVMYVWFQKKIHTHLMEDHWKFLWGGGGGGLKS